MRAPLNRRNFGKIRNARLESDETEIGFALVVLHRQHAIRFERAVKFGIFARCDPERVDVPLSAPRYDLAEPNGFQAAVPLAWATPHHPILAVLLSGRPRYPCACDAERRNHPREDGWNDAEREPHKTKNHERPRQCSEKVGDGREPE
jgi:hypothetical protein